MCATIWQPRLQQARRPAQDVFNVAVSHPLIATLLIKRARRILLFCSDYIAAPTKRACAFGRANSRCNFRGITKGAVRLIVLGYRDGVSRMLRPPAERDHKMHRLSSAAMCASRRFLLTGSMRDKLGKNFTRARSRQSFYSLRDSELK